MTPLGELTALPHTSQLVGRGLSAPSQRIPPHFGPLGLAEDGSLFLSFLNVAISALVYSLLVIMDSNRCIASNFDMHYYTGRLC